MDVEVVVPETYMGSVVGDLNSRRGKISGMVARGDLQVIAVSRVRCRKCSGTPTRSAISSQGRAVFTMQFSKYAPVPQEVSKKMLERVAL